MGRQPATHSDSRDVPRATSPALLMVATAFDTTWRMFVPILGCLGLGLWADKRFTTTPWLMIAGLVLGTAIAARLVYGQYKKVGSS